MRSDRSSTPGHRSYWDNLFFENRGGTTTLFIRHLKLVMRYADPPGSSPKGINHAEIPMVDWDLNMSLLAGDDEIDLTEFAKRSLHGWAGLADSDPGVVRRAVHDVGKSCGWSRSTRTRRKTGRTSGWGASINRV